MKKIGKLFFTNLLPILFFSFLGLRSAFASPEVNVSVEVNPENPVLGEQFQVELTIQSNEELQIEDPEFPQTEGLNLLQAQNGGQSSSARMNIINGKTEFSKTVIQRYDYILQATKMGVITIPSFKVIANGQTIASAPRKISISKTQTNRPRPRQAPTNPLGEEDDDDMFSQLLKQRQKMIEEMQKQMGQGGLPRGFGSGGGNNPLNQFFGSGNQPDEVQSKKLDVNEREAFFVYLDIDKKEVYEGQQITANWYIYTRGNLDSIDRAKFPDLKGFWKEIIEEVPNLQFVEEIVNGVRFKKGLLASHALFPIKPGVSVVDEFKIKGKVRLLTQFGWGQPSEYTRASRRAEIKVLPLPVEGKPHSFSGAVGQFRIQTQVDGLQFPANQPFTLKVRFEGSGNAKLIELPPIEWPNGLEVYDTKSESKFFKDGQSYKEFEILLVPKNRGDVKIPQIVFSYFDPETKKYVTKTTEALDLKIIEGLPDSTKPQSAKTDSVSENLVAIGPILELPGNFSWQANRYSILFGGLLACFSLIFGLFSKDYFQINLGPQFKKMIEQKVSKISKLVNTNEDRKVGSESVHLIYLLLAQMAQDKTAGNEWAQIISKVPQSYRDKYEAELSEMFEYFQMIGFAPEHVKSQLVAKKTISQAFNQLKKLSELIVSDLPKI